MSTAKMERIDEAALRTGISVPTLRRRLQEAGLSRRGVPTVLRASRWDDLAERCRCRKQKRTCKHCERAHFANGMCQRCAYRVKHGIPVDLPMMRSKLCVECEVRPPDLMVLDDRSRLCTQCFFELNTPRNAPANTNARTNANCGT